MTNEAGTDSLITPEMRDAIGEAEPPVHLEVDKTGIRQFARAVGHTDRIYYDEAYARSKGHRSLVAPPGYFGLVVFDPAAAALPQGRFGTIGADNRVARVLNGGTEFDMTGPDVCAGDSLTSVSKITSMVERDTSLGRMIISRRETVYTNQDGEVVATAAGTLLWY